MNRMIEAVETTRPTNGLAWPPSSPLRQLVFYALCTLLAGNQCYGAAPASADFADLSIEELGNIQVTSVSKKEERLADAAAAIYVITNDAIRRSGARSLPEALRLAPNLQVAQINASQYAISARGFNSSTANKLLVLIDGRAVYTPLYSGVFWDAQDVLLDDVERIEVISGPGGTLWGANAVNGVINVITRSATATAATLLQTTLGGSGQGIAVRHGGALGDSGGGYRIYAKFDNLRHTVRADGSAVPDAWERAQAGFRSDWRDARDALTVQGDIYRAALDQAAPGRQHLSGANLLARLNRQLADGSELRVQTYFDRSTRELPGVFSEELDTLDLDVQHSLPEEGGKQLIWGGGYRISDDRIKNSAVLAFLPANRKLHWANLFAQQEFSLRPGLRFTAGAKLEFNDYTGLELLPNLKLAWKPDDGKLLWTGLARAVRAPSRIDREFFVPGAPPFLFAGGTDFRSEIANTLDLGFRAQHGATLAYSLVLFHSRYDHLRSVDTDNGAFVLRNQIKGRVDGLEAWASYQLTSSWSLRAGALLLHERFSGGNLAQSPPGNDPRSQWTLGSKLNIDDRRDLDVSLRRVGKLPSPAVPAYTAVDARFGWRVSKGLELSLTGRNLFDRRHQEFASGSGAPAANPQIERSIDMALTARF